MKVFKQSEIYLFPTISYYKMDSDLYWSLWIYFLRYRINVYTKYTGE